MYKFEKTAILFACMNMSICSPNTSFEQEIYFFPYYNLKRYCVTELFQAWEEYTSCAVTILFTEIFSPSTNHYVCTSSVVFITEWRTPCEVSTSESFLACLRPVKQRLQYVSPKKFKVLLLLASVPHVRDDILSFVFITSQKHLWLLENISIVCTQE